MKIKYLCALLLAALTYSCDDTTPGIGDTTIPDGDHIQAGGKIYDVTTRSILADSVYARTSTAYLGRSTDPQFGEFTSDFIAQFNCTDDFEFPEAVQEITGLTLFVQYTKFFGDSLNSMRMRIDTLDKVIPEGDLNTFYTNVNPDNYYNENAKPIAEKAYSAGGTDAHLTDTLSSRYYTQTIKLPTNLGKFMYEKYKEDKNNYKNADAFIKNVLKGIYVRCTHGDGTILYIDNLDLRMHFSRLIKSSSNKLDSLVNTFADFAATKEVIQANRFQNSERLKELVDKDNCTYIKTPAGIYTEATLPVDEIYEAHQNDTLNAATLSFTRFNEKNNSSFAMGIPQYLIMVRKKEMYSFFEENKITDNISSFITSFTSNSNKYTFSNIAQLITHCIEEKKKGEAGDPDWVKKNPDWNKVVLIPVKVDFDTNNSIIGVSNNLDMESAELKGGTKAGNELKMQIIYTKF